jgi:Fic-DOC domain mobile mystery protein B
VTDLFEAAEGATPIHPDDQKKLIPTGIQNRGDLNVAEEDNIASGLAWAKRRRAQPQTIVSESFSRALHKAMFGKVWRWAGAYREVELQGIGAPRWQIAAKCAELFEQYRYWIEHETFSADETAVRFHHAIVFVHPFTNGNGRHSRLMADLLIERLGSEPFSWGDGNLQDSTSALRRSYIAALRKADAGDFADLLRFARSQGRQ